MERAKVTKDLIFQTLDQIEAEKNAEPTLEEVRQRIGGSLSTLSPAKKEWLESRKAAVSTSMIRESAPEAITERLSVLASDIWGVARDLANQRLAADKEAMEVTRAVLDKELREATEATAGIEKERDDALAEVAALKDKLHMGELRARSVADENERLKGEISVHEHTIDRLKEQLGDAQARHEELMRKEVIARSDADNLRRDLDSLQSQMKETQAEARRVQQDLIGAERRASTASAQAEERGQRAQAHENTITALEADLAMARSIQGETAAALAGAKAAADERGNTINVLQKQVDDLRAQLADKSSQSGEAK